MPRADSTATTSELERLGSALTEALSGHPVVRFAVIYGSAAGGRLRPDSDIDLGVAGTRPLTLDERLDLAMHLGSIVGRDVDVVDLTAASGLILKEVLAGHAPILNREPELYAGLMKRMWFEEADWGPLRRRAARVSVRQWAGEGQP